MLQRLLPPLLVVLLVAGCGGSKSSSGTATATAGSAKRIKVGLVTDINQLNDRGLLFREQEVGYLAGYLAGLVEKQKPGPDVIGSVGGMKEPPVDRFIAGYQAGAKKADPGIKLLNAYSHDWVDLAKCKEAALSQIASGSSIEFQVAGGCGL